MYPSRELTELAARKAVLQARIAVRRHECTIAAHRLAQPIAFVDRAVDTWRKILPLVKLAGLPMSFFATRALLRKKTRGRLASVMRFLPVVLRGARLVMQAKSARATAAAHK